MFPRSVRRRLTVMIFVSSVFMLILHMNVVDHVETKIPSFPSPPNFSNKTTPKNAPVLEAIQHSRRRCRLSCYVIATSSHTEERIAAINQTWMSRCDYGQFFFTDKKHISLRIPGNAIFSSGKNNFTASYKAILSLRYAYYNLSSKSDWYYLASDDTYVVVENMCQYLATLNPNNPYFVAVTESESSDTTATDDDDAIEYIVSRAALHRLVEEETVDCSSSSDKSFDLTRCLQSMNIHSLDTRNEQGQQRLFANRRRNKHHRKDAIPGDEADMLIAPDLISLHHLTSNDIRIYDELIYRLRSLNSSKFYIGDTSKHSNLNPGVGEDDTAMKSTGGKTTTVKPKRFYIDVPLCPNSTMNEMFRHTMLAMHNNYRSSIAIGNKEVNGDIGIAPPAKLMYNMIYHCDAERLAELHVQNCDGKMSPSTARPGFTENIHILDGVWRTDLMGAAQNAVSTWWSELAKHGIRSDMLYTRKISRRKRKRLSSFSKMAWWNNVFIGCAIQACDDFYFTSCMYGPGGNIVDAKIYEIGAPCSGCGPTCNPEAGLCTWNKSIVD